MSFKMLVLMDRPDMTTGFARVGTNLVRRWASATVTTSDPEVGSELVFERIDIWGVASIGHPGMPKEVGAQWWDAIDPKTLKRRHVVYGQYRGGHWWSQENAGDFLDLLLQGDYTHVWIIQDHFMLVQHGFHRALKDVCDRKGVRSLWYCPVDAPMEAAWAQVAPCFDAVAAYTEYGRKELERHLGQRDAGPEMRVAKITANVAEMEAGEAMTHLQATMAAYGVPRTFGPEIEVIPHGVEPGVYFPLPEAATRSGRAAFKKRCLPQFADPAAYLLLNVNFHQRRKDAVRSLEILARLKEYAAKLAQERGQAMPRFQLVMHMKRVSKHQVDLELVGRELGLEYGQDWMHGDHVFDQRGSGRLNEEQLNQLYNLADAYLTTSLGEGWGLGLTEALAAGCTLFAPDHTSCEEIFRTVAGLDPEKAEQQFELLALEERPIYLDDDNCRPRWRVDVDAAAATILAHVLAYGDSDEPRRAPNAAVLDWLNWDRIAGQWLGLMVQEVRVAPEGKTDGCRSEPDGLVTLLSLPKRGNHYYIEYGGGLGDMFNGMYFRGSYNLLRDLQENETATVALICHNPAAPEIFEYHPKVISGQVRVIAPGYWDPKEDEAMRRKWGLPRRGAMLPIPDKAETLSAPLQWHIGPDDKEVLRSLWGLKYFVLAAGAGLPARNLPQAIIDHVCHRLLTEFPSHSIVVVGRDYERHGKAEPRPQISSPGLIDLRNKLKVPGTALLLQRAAGLVTAHSALNILGWNMCPQMPQLLFYNEAVRQHHFDWLTEDGMKKGKKQDEWSFGVNTGYTIHGSWQRDVASQCDDYQKLTGEFIELVRNCQAVFECEPHRPMAAPAGREPHRPVAARPFPAGKPMLQTGDRSKVVPGTAS